MSHDFQAKATTLNFLGEKEMFEGLYKTMSLQQLATSLGISLHLCRKKLVEHGVIVRQRGGPNGLKLVMTQAIVDDMKTRSANSIALELGVSKYTLFKQKAKWLKEHPAEPQAVQAEPGKQDVQEGQDEPEEERLATLDPDEPADP